MLDTAQPKPRPHKRVQASNRRTEAKIKRQVRAACVERDGYCRLGARFWRDGFLVDAWNSYCADLSEWAHLGDHKRFKTRGKPAAERHTTGGSLMLCGTHHRMYDQGRLAITALSERGADGPLRFERAS